MKQEWKQPWVDALRSGQYKQGRLELHNTRDDTYCCLGVLQDVCAKGGLVIDEAADSFYLHRSQADEQLELSKETQSELAKMNDGGKSFAQIADFIEQTL